MQLPSIFYFLKRKVNHLIELFLPAHCLICTLKSDNKLICLHCQQALIKERTCCQSCALPLSQSQTHCGGCLTNPHLFTKLHAIDDYQAPYTNLIKGFKYSKQLLNGEALAELLALSLLYNFSSAELSKVDYLIPVPLYKKKHRQRGFNQAQLIAQLLAKKFSIPLLNKAVERVKHTNVQEGLSVKKRKRNLHNAFSVNKEESQKLAGRHIVIIDDVVTTGATVNSLSQVLLEAGVKHIDVWCICRTSLIAKKQAKK